MVNSIINLNGSKFSQKKKKKKKDRPKKRSIDLFNAIYKLAQAIWGQRWYWVGKVRSLRALYLGSILAACKSPLVGILSEGWPSHTVLGWASSSWSQYWLPARGYNITIKALIFVSRKKKGVLFIYLLFKCLLNINNFLFKIYFSYILMFLLRTFILQSIWTSL